MKAWSILMETSCFPWGRNGIV